MGEKERREGEKEDVKKGKDRARGSQKILDLKQCNKNYRTSNNSTAFPFLKSA